MYDGCCRDGGGGSDRLVAVRLLLAPAESFRVDLKFNSGGICFSDLSLLLLLAAEYID